MSIDIDYSSAPTKPAGNDTEVQFNDDGVFGADAGFVWDKAAGLLTVKNLLVKPTSNSTTTFQVQQSNGALVLTGDTTNGRIGVGIAPEYPFHVASASDNTIYIEDTRVFPAALGSSERGPSLYFRGPSSKQGDQKLVGRIYAQATQAFSPDQRYDLTFHTRDAGSLVEVLRIKDTGNVAFTGFISLNKASVVNEQKWINLVATSGSGSAINQYGYYFKTSASHAATTTYGFYANLHQTNGTRYGFYQTGQNVFGARYGAYFLDPVGINRTVPTSMLHVVANDAAKIGQIIKGAASQTAALFQLQESDGSVMLDSGDGLGGSVFSGNQQLEDIDFVWAGDTEANLFRVDAGTDTVRMGDWDTNYVTTSKAGLMSFVGTGGLYFGHIYTNGTIAVTITDTTPVEVGDTFTTGEMNGCSFGSAHYIDVGANGAGKYLVSWSMSIAQNSPSAAIQCEQGIMIDGTAQVLGRAHRTIANSNDIGASAGTAIIDLAANKQVSLYVANLTNGTNIDVEHANLTITQIGGT